MRHLQSIPGSVPSRAGWLTPLAFVCVLSLPVAVFAQGAAATAKKPATSQNMTVQTRDGQTLHCTYFPSTAGKAAPVAILLHGKGGNRLSWQTGTGSIPGFAQALQTNDFAVICVDLRQHGENIAGGATGKSAPTQLVPRDYQAMVSLDLEAVKKFIYEEHQKEALNMNKLGIVATDFSTSVALMYAELDWSKEPFDDAPVLAQRTPRGQDVKALILISPDTRVPGLNVNTASTRLRTLQMPVMIAVGKRDNQDKGSAKRLADQLMPRADEKPYVQYVTYDSNLRGTDMLNKGLGLEPQMYKFFDENVKKAPGEWRNRKSPLQD